MISVNTICLHQTLLLHILGVLKLKLFMGTFDSLLVKYGAVMVGYTVVGLPVFGGNRKRYIEKVKGDPSVITRDYVRNSSLLINLAKVCHIINLYYLYYLIGYWTLCCIIQINPTIGWIHFFGFGNVISSFRFE